MTVNILIELESLTSWSKAEEIPACVTDDFFFALWGIEGWNWQNMQRNREKFGTKLWEAEWIRCQYSKLCFLRFASSAKKTPDRQARKM